MISISAWNASADGGMYRPPRSSGRPSRHISEPGDRRGRSPSRCWGGADTPIRRAARARSCARSGVVLAIADTGPLYAVIDQDDADHRRSLGVLRRSDLELVIPALVVVEVSYLVGT